MRYVIALLFLTGSALADETSCPAKAGDPCRAEQDKACKAGKNPPPWSTPEDEARKKEKAERELAACRERHKDDPPPSEKNPSPLPPWRKP